MKKARILLADDHKIVLEGLKGLLEPAYEIIGTAANGRELVELAGLSRPDVIVADVSMPLLNGSEALKQMRQAGITAPVVFLTMHPDTTYATRAVEAGALGYVLKQEASDDLIRAIESARVGKIFRSAALQAPAVAERLDASRDVRKPTIELTPRQREILQLLAEGKSAKEIGGLLNISQRTVETHKYKMMDDLGLHSSAQLVQYAIKHGLTSGA
jgi:DNA-binding NarL/FixJ family response regulator